MRIFVPRETEPGETRIAMIPGSAEKIVKLGAELEVEAGIGQSLGFPDEAYAKAGAKLSSDRAASLAAADMVLRLRKPPVDEVKALKSGCIHVSYMDPFFSHDLVRAMAEAKVSGVSIEMIPRSTIAQKMDALSSQANLGGYVAVVLAAERLKQVLPMMTTPAGTLAPARVFVIGVGVAGLQAIATAKRLGARVEAFDTRAVVEEQVHSLGAKFVKIDLGETGQTKDGYAKALTEEQLKKQREGMIKVCAQSDVIVAAAQVFGRKAPVVVTREMVSSMKPGSIVVDTAVENGGNVEGSVLGQEVEVNGVKIIGLPNLPGRVPVHASQMYASNLAYFVEHFWDKQSKAFALKLDDEIIRGCLITFDGQVVNETIKKVVTS